MNGRHNDRRDRVCKRHSNRGESTEEWDGLSSKKLNTKSLLKFWNIKYCQVRKIL